MSQSKHKKILTIIFGSILLIGLIYFFAMINAKSESEITLKNNEYVFKQTALEGEWICLSYKKELNLQENRCEVGVKTDNGLSYALDTILIEGDRTRLKTGDRVRMEGLLVPIEEISADYWQKYDIEGIMKVEILEKL